jgi:hypothetical protein
MFFSSCQKVHPAGKEIFPQTLLQADYGSKLQFHGLRLDLQKTFFMRNAG